MKPLEIKLTIRPSSIDNWWVLERLEHDNKIWQESTEYGSRFCTSGRLEKTTDIEGESEQWKEMAEAIKKGTEYSARRCSVKCLSYGVELESPRNSSEPTLVSWDSAIFLMKEIEKKLL